MATREQLIERVADIMMPLYIEEWRPPSDVDYAIAEHILDAILPQVTTVEQLEVLPSGTVLVTPLGRVWKRSHPGWNYPWCDTSSVATSSAALIEAGPLTVVWQPS